MQDFQGEQASRVGNRTVEVLANVGILEDLWWGTTTVEPVQQA